MAEIIVDCIGETCPVSLVETRKALRKARRGDIIKVTGIIRRMDAGKKGSCDSWKNTKI
jgi:hypothetical protein